MSHFGVVSNDLLCRINQATACLGLDLNIYHLVPNGVELLLKNFKLRLQIETNSFRLSVFFASSFLPSYTFLNLDKEQEAVPLTIQEELTSVCVCPLPV